MEIFLRLESIMGVTECDFPIPKYDGVETKEYISFSDMILDLDIFENVYFMFKYITKLNMLGLKSELKLSEIFDLSYLREGDILPTDEVFDYSFLDDLALNNLRNFRELNIISLFSYLQPKELELYRLLKQCENNISRKIANSFNDFGEGEVIIDKKSVKSLRFQTYKREFRQCVKQFTENIKLPDSILFDGEFFQGFIDDVFFKYRLMFVDGVSSIKDIGSRFKIGDIVRIIDGEDSLLGLESTRHDFINYFNALSELNLEKYGVDFESEVKTFRDNCGVIKMKYESIINDIKCQALEVYDIRGVKTYYEFVEHINGFTETIYYHKSRVKRLSCDTIFYDVNKNVIGKNSCYTIHEYTKNGNKQFFKTLNDSDFITSVKDLKKTDRLIRKHLDGSNIYTITGRIESVGSDGFNSFDVSKFVNESDINTSYKYNQSYLSPIKTSVEASNYFSKCSIYAYISSIRSSLIDYDTEYSSIDEIKRFYDNAFISPSTKYPKIDLNEIVLVCDGKEMKSLECRSNINVEFSNRIVVNNYKKRIRK